ncbi:hypothetical protein ACFQZF_05370 [Flavobacterium myungsuense]|uniref:DUF1566 domain-containing protein n=1 Tax=Flavobacterium myungsuense TaxID=651823 RepID=A0ABW3J1M4_9FLAO
MKKRNLHLFIFILFFGIFLSNAQVGINTTTPNAQLEIKSSNQATPNNTDGILIPKIDTFPVINPTAAQQGMMVYLTTTIGVNLPGFYYWDNTGVPSWKAVGGNTPASFTHYIGELYQGGIIVDVWKEGGVERGLIASLVDMSIPGPFPFYIPWTSSAVQCATASGAISQTNGKANTVAILVQNGNAINTAAYVCDQYSNSGYDDWYLPSNFELDRCYDAALIINRILPPSNGFKVDQNVYYWSSTQQPFLPCFAYAKIFDLAYTTQQTKLNNHLVRAVRMF